MTAQLAVAVAQFAPTADRSANLARIAELTEIAVDRGAGVVVFPEYSSYFVDPFDDSLIQPSSVDVRLDSLFRVFNNTRYTHIDPALRQDDLTTLVEPKEGEPFVLHPGEFVLGATLERCTLPDDLAGRLEGKSSLGRLGLLTHSTAGFIDPGFSGHVTLELSNMATLPIKLWPGSKIGQLCFFKLTSETENPYGSGRYGNRYQGQRGPTASRSHLNFHRTIIEN